MVGWMSPVSLTLREVLGDAAVERLLGLSAVHCHGWGAAWSDGDGPIVRRSTVPASEDPGFAELVDGLSARAAIVHLRLGTPGYGRDVEDNHPFVAHGWALAHNGAVAPTSGVDALLPPGTLATGSTDSERWFLALLDELDAGRDVAQAVGQVVERAELAGLHASSWNSMLLGPNALYVINHHDTSWIPIDIQLWPDVLPDGVSCWPPYFDLRCRQRDGSYAVISSGIVDDVSNWSLLPNPSVLRLGLAEPRFALSGLHVASPNRA
jgi:predicted glutamine amidotransferase